MPRVYPWFYSYGLSMEKIYLEKGSDIYFLVLAGRNSFFGSRLEAVKASDDPGTGINRISCGCHSHGGKMAQGRMAVVSGRGFILLPAVRFAPA